MTVHLLKMAVGVESIDHLSRLQAARLKQAEQAGEDAVLRHFTRNMPRRLADIRRDGSIYWVVRGYISVRQRVLDCERRSRPDGRPACALILDPALVRTEPRACRPFQGWRYLAPAKAPTDVSVTGSAIEDMPADMADELRTLGLL